MIRTAHPRGRSPFGVPSRDRIRHLTSEIRKSWSPRTRARRAVEGARRVELLVISAQLFDDAEARGGDEQI
jgi:hypothetical protein